MINFYKTNRWLKLRRAVLARDGYRCQIARRYGKNIPANTVHHIFPRDAYPQYQWESWNLISVSKEMHNELHDRVTNELTEKGRELLERTARKKGIVL